MKKVFDLPPKLYYTGSPIIVMEGSFFEGDETKNTYFRPILRNITEKTITLIKVCVKPYDSIGRLEGLPFEAEYSSLDIQPRCDSYELNPCIIPCKKATSFGISITLICFGDGTLWTCEDCDWGPLTVRFPESNISELSDKEGASLSELRIYFAKNAKSAGETVYIKSVALTSDRFELATLTGEQVVKPMDTTIKIPGLKNNYKFLQVTDLHSSAFTTEETKAMTSARVNLITGRRNAFKGGSFLSEERMPYLFSYADKIEADMLLLTGDILDFPSQKNLQLLRENIANIKTPAF